MNVYLMQSDIVVGIDDAEALVGALLRLILEGFVENVLYCVLAVAS